MDVSAWLLYTFIAALAMAAAVAHYRWREPDGRGRTVLGVTRGAALALIVLLLFDPLIPATGDGDRTVVALVDASLSMSLAGEDGVARWDSARALVATSGAQRIHLFGAGQDRVVSGLDEASPTGTRSRLAPALRGVLEAGAGRVVVITDGAVDDAAEVRRIAAESSVPIEVRTVGGGTRFNLSLDEVESPRWLEVGAVSVIRFTVGRSGELGAPPTDSATVVLTRAGRELARARVAVPPPGRGSSGELRFRPESAVEGAVRLDVEVEPGGGVADDDVRSLYVRIADEPAGVALVSLKPDQEPRFLMPVLDRALGLPVRGWIGLSEDRFVEIGTGREAGAVTTGATVRRTVTEAALVVVHGADDTAPVWVRTALAEAERVLVFPSDPAPSLPVPIRALRVGDWYVMPEVPSSPVAPLLAGIETAGLPPLVALRTPAIPEGYWAPLVARMGRRGEAYPVAMAGAPEGRRLAIALGEGYWRWAFAGRDGRAVYERVWSAVAGWLIEDIDTIDPEVIRPVRRVVERGAPVEWAAPTDGDSITMTIDREGAGQDSPAGGDLAVDTTVGIEGGRAFTAPLPPGHYRYRARTRDAAATDGSFTVESYSSELAAAAVSLDGLVGGRGEDARAGGGRPLRTAALPYILVLGLLCVEWVLRRRWGLR